MFGGVEALTHEAVLVINLPGVWGVNLLALYAAAFGGIGWGLIGIDLTVVNGVTHVVAALAGRKYNPGLWTSLALFLPVGGFAMWVVSGELGVTAWQKGAGLGSALLIHAAIVGYTKREAARKRK